MVTGLDDYESRAIIVSTGSYYRRLDIPGEEDLVGRGVHFCATCDAPFYKGESILVIGGGNSALEEGIYLTDFADHVTTLMNKTSLEFLSNADGSFRALRVRDNETGEE